MSLCQCAPIMALIGHVLCRPGCFLLSFPTTDDSTILSSIPRLPLMSHTNPTSTSSKFRLIFDNAMKAYKKRTKKDLLTHPLADRLEICDSASSILTVLREQVQEFNESQPNNTKWLDPTERPSYLLRDTRRRCQLGMLQDMIVRDLLSHICLKVFSPAKVIFIGFAVLLSVCTLLNTFVRYIVIQMTLRQLRPFARIKTHFSRCSSV